MPKQFQFALERYYHKRYQRTVKNEVFVCAHAYGGGLLGVMMGVAKAVEDAGLKKRVEVVTDRLRRLWERELRTLLRDARESDVLLV